MMKFLELFIDAVIVWVAAYFVGNTLLEKNNRNLISKILIVFVFSIILAYLNMFNFEIFHGTIKIIGTYILQCLYYKIMFNKTFSKSMIIALIWYLCLCASEVIIALIASIILSNVHNSLAFLKNTIVINLLVSSLILIITRISRKKLITFVKHNNIEDKSNLIIVLIVLITLALLGFKIPVSNWSFNIEFIITMILLLSFCIIGIFMLKQKSDIQKNISMYQQLADYSNITNNVLEEYRVVTHEHKNQLLIIRSMLENKDKDING